MSDFLRQIEQLINVPEFLHQSSSELGKIIISTAIFYFLLILIFHTFGKRSIAHLSTYDFVVTLAIGSVVASTIILDVQFTSGLVAVLILFILQFVITFISSRFGKLFSFLNSSPRVLYYKGEFLEENMVKSRITKREIYSAIRKSGECTSDFVEAIVLEPDGRLSIIKEMSEERAQEITQFIDT